MKLQKIQVKYILAHLQGGDCEIRIMVQKNIRKNLFEKDYVMKHSVNKSRFILVENERKKK